MPDQEPDVLRLLREFRRALDAQDQVLVDRMAREWLKVMKRLDADIEVLAQEMKARKEAGIAITEGMVRLDRRYLNLKKQMETELGKYSEEYALTEISDAQRTAGVMGLKSAQGAIRVQADAVFHHIDQGAVETMVGLLKDGSPLTTLLKYAVPDAEQGVMDALVNGVARGYGIQQITREMIAGSGVGLDRAVTIARTEVARAYRETSLRQYRESRVVVGYKRIVKKETACLGCLMLDGKYYTIESDMNDHPKGKCGLIPIVRGSLGPIWKKGIEWFKGLDPEAQKEKMGHEKYELWTKGGFELEQLTAYSHSEIYGDQPRVATLAELKGTAG